ncbi:MAG TPA: hypothetical protein IGR64_13790 [Leptolyngbyaceae cyanobacterium M65_K2018_010]|nr:hypothetical protein [Leptolyngbyaceae cyanobacterium M65_K2018_010]
MNSDSDTIKDILLGLLLESVLWEDPQSGDRHLAKANDPELPDPPAMSWEDRDPRFNAVDRQGLDPLAAADQELFENPIGADTTAVFNPGDLPAVQTHFEALLKRRLKQEIANHPPLFPWEKALQEYPDTLKPDAGAASVWLDHLQSLPVPGQLPEAVLSELLYQCQQVAEQTTQLGRRLVSAVESLFPDQAETLDYIAGLVARPAYRSAQTQTLAELDYASAAPQQQIALAMLAAQGIFDALSLRVSPANPEVSRTWVTGLGPVIVTATYLPDQILQVRVNLPTAGAISFLGEGHTTGANRSTPGDLMLRVEATPASSAARLEVLLDQAETPLGFQVWVEPA